MSQNYRKQPNRNSFCCCVDCAEAAGFGLVSVRQLKTSHIMQSCPTPGPGLDSSFPYFAHKGRSIIHFRSDIQPQSDMNDKEKENSFVESQHGK